ncbi:MAG: hypothetical protein ACP5PX_03530 [Candidatus Hadarchaeum sp.]|uniref:hypothetical protein n=1 Tax=Candidatus Hadarchaeum sp. TaxID=2883567 RepID=UPI003D0AB12A
MDKSAFVDLEEIAKNLNSLGRKTVIRIRKDRIWIRTLPLGEHCGHRSKEIKVRRFIELDDLFLGMGPWQVGAEK